MAVIARDTARISPARTDSAHFSTGSATAGGIAALVDVFGARQTWTAIIADLLLAEKLARDDQTLNFAGALTDGAKLHVAIELLGRIVLDEPVATVDLYALVGHFDGHFTRVQLG